MGGSRQAFSRGSEVRVPRPYEAVVEAISRTPPIIGIDALERYFICTLPLTDPDRRELSDALEVVRRLVERVGGPRDGVP